MDLQIYKRHLESIRQTYELYAASGANIHTFNSLYAKAVNVLALAERDLRLNGFIPAEREAEVKEHFNNLCEYIGKLVSPTTKFM